MDDFLLKQIDEFRDKAQQLQDLINTKETKVRELQLLVDERESKATKLQMELDERQREADSLVGNVEEQVDKLIKKSKFSKMTIQRTSRMHWMGCLRTLVR